MKTLRGLLFFITLSPEVVLHKFLLHFCHVKKNSHMIKQAWKAHGIVDSFLLYNQLDLCVSLKLSKGMTLLAADLCNFTKKL